MHALDDYTCLRMYSAHACCYVSQELSIMHACSLGALANNVGEDKVRTLLTSLCDKLMSGKKDSHRETASLGLKAVIADLSPASLAALPFTVPSVVLPKIKQGLQATVSQPHPCC